MPAPICLQWKTAVGEVWNTMECSRIPVASNVKIRIDFSRAPKISDPEKLIEAIKSLVRRVGGKTDTQAPGALVGLDAGDHLLEIVVSDGETGIVADERIKQMMQHPRPPGQWVLPLMPSNWQVNVARILPEELRGQNVAFWKNSIEEMALVVFARAGVTSLDRRVFISYRRQDAEPMALQLFTEFESMNFSVFLDTVSVDPGVDFQSRLFESLADKSIVLLIHSETFSQSKWTMAEIVYAREHDLSVLILRLPSVAENDPLDQYYRAGDLVRLIDEDIERVENKTSKPQYRLTDAALGAIVAQVLEQHDEEMINRLAFLRERMLEALQANSIHYDESQYGVSIFASSSASNGAKTYRLFPVSRPPGLPELFAADTFKLEQGDRRIVVGNVSSFSSERVEQMDWTIAGRNVIYVDVSMLDCVAREISSGTL